MFHSSTGDERIATQPGPTGVTIAGIQNQYHHIASPPTADRNKKPRTASGFNIFESNTVMTYSTPKEFVCHHQY